MSLNTNNDKNVRSVTDGSYDVMVATMIISDISNAITYRVDNT